MVPTVLFRWCIRVGILAIHLNRFSEAGNTLNFNALQMSSRINERVQYWMSASSMHFPKAKPRSINANCRIVEWELERERGGEREREREFINRRSQYPSVFAAPPSMPFWNSHLINFRKQRILILERYWSVGSWPMLLNYTSMFIIKQSQVWGTNLCTACSSSNQSSQRSQQKRSHGIHVQIKY